jgi:hypothetical protein
MNAHFVISAFFNLLIIGLLISYGLMLFAEYHAKGRWAKNVTGLLAGLGMLSLALALLITPSNAELIARIAVTGAPRVFLGLSSALLLAAIAAFGIISYSRPFRLWLERKIEQDLKRDLPKVP